jgi:predicted lipoprotein with Yx(FWY)xxD motif
VQRIDLRQVGRSVSLLCVAIAVVAAAGWAIWAAIGTPPRPAGRSSEPGAAGPIPEPPAAPVVPPGDRTTRLVGHADALVTDGDGFTLYRTDRDRAMPPTPTCMDACADTWAPVLAGNGMPAVQGIDAALVGTVTRPDGGHQLTLAGWPLYRYSGDREPGTRNGHGADGTWWAVTPAGWPGP